MSLGIGCNIARRREWGSLGSIRVTHEGKGREGDKGRGGACFPGFDAKVTRRWCVVGGPKAKKEDGLGVMA